MPTEKGREVMRALLEEGEAAARAGDWGAAREAAGRALAIDPESVTASALLERATSMQRTQAPAHRATRPRTQEDLTEILRLLDESEAAARAGDWEQARRSAQQILTIDPDNMPASTLSERASQMLREPATSMPDTPAPSTPDRGEPTVIPPPSPSRPITDPQAAWSQSTPFPRKQSHAGRNIALTIGGIFAFLVVLGLIGNALGSDDEESPAAASTAAVRAGTVSPAQRTSTGASCGTAAHQSYLLTMGAEAIELSGLFTDLSGALDRGDFAEVQSLSFDMEALYEAIGSHTVPSGYEPIQREIEIAASTGAESMPLLREGLSTANATILNRAADRLSESNDAVERANRLVTPLAAGACP